MAPTLSFDSSTTKTNNSFKVNITKIHRDTSSFASTLSSFIGFHQIANATHWLKAGERSLGDLIPLISMPSDIKVSLVDYFIKIVYGDVTFGLVSTTLKRKFERK